jgi:transglutaminase-like putative cysteine protease
MQIASKPLFKEYVITNSQTAKDIASAIIKSIKDSQTTANLLAPYLRSNSKLQTLKNIFIFCKNNVTYKKEGKELQTAKTLARVLAEKHGDCKHYSTLCYSLCKALGIDCKLRLISQNFYNTDPTHIYVIAKINGQTIVIDPVLKSFNDEARYYYKYDIKA